MTNLKSQELETKAEQLCLWAYDESNPKRMQKACDSRDNGKDTTNEKIGKRTEENRELWDYYYMYWSVLTAAYEYELFEIKQFPFFTQGLN